MSGAYLVVRLSNHGTLLGDAVYGNPGSRVTCIGSGRHDHGGRPIIDHLALVEGIPDAELSRILLTWERLHGEAPHVLGGPFALRLPVALDGPHTGTVSLCLQLGAILSDVAQCVSGDVLELWGRCTSRDEALAMCEQVRRALAGSGILSVEVAQPTRDDLECWDLLRLAAQDLVRDCEAPLAA